jgi:hypothetical protein
MASLFKIQILEQGWLKGCYSQEDLCSHGKISLIIGDTKIANEEDSFGISESALAMLRTIGSNHSADSPVAQRMVFHGCGTILMMGCPVGIDWSVTHLDSETVRIGDIVWYEVTDENKAKRYAGLTVEMPIQEYRSQVCAFARQDRELFHGVTKRFDDVFVRQQYEEFWSEYNELLARHAL